MKLIIIDVNGLLLHREFVHSTKKRNISPSHVIGKFNIYLRTGTVDFLHWCAQNFVVVIWGTAAKLNLDSLLPVLFPGDTQPALVLNGDDCTTTNIFDPFKPGKELLLKDITKVWNAAEITKLGLFNENNSLMIDDAFYKMILNPTWCCVSPRSWDPSKNINTFENLYDLLSMYRASESSQECTSSFAFDGAVWNLDRNDNMSNLLRAHIVREGRSEAERLVPLCF